MVGGLRVKLSVDGGVGRYDLIQEFAMLIIDPYRIVVPKHATSLYMGLPTNSLSINAMTSAASPCPLSYSSSSPHHFGDISNGAICRSGKFL